MAQNKYAGTQTEKILQRLQKKKDFQSLPQSFVQ